MTIPDYICLSDDIFDRDTGYPNYLNFNFIPLTNRNTRRILYFRYYKIAADV